MAESSDLRITSRLRIPFAELTYRASRSGGPGGQHVNTSSTRIELTWSVPESRVLSDELRARLLEKLAPRLDGRGVLRLVGSEARSQLQNREAVTVRFVHLLQAALRVPKIRKATQPTRASIQRRLEEKKRRSAVKRDRRRGPDE